jgi:hypothetical protein
MRDVHPHLLRHATGFKLVNDGVDTRTLAAYLGHRQIANTARYTKMDAKRFDRFWQDWWESALVVALGGGVTGRALWSRNASPRAKPARAKGTRSGKAFRDRGGGVELALKFPLVLNRLVAGCERPRLLVRDVPEPAGWREEQPNEHYDTWMTYRAVAFKTTEVALARTLMRNGMLGILRRTQWA